ncbi:MAG: hypothetical protein QOJ99_1504 [Bryobacterales bacterium]|jgi:hypothetical protein|nr:hypothetical protein [Bryobacterales bacterium]
MVAKSTVRAVPARKRSNACFWILSKLLKRWSGRPGSNRRRSAWEFHVPLIPLDLAVHSNSLQARKCMQFLYRSAHAAIRRRTVVRRQDPLN